MLRWPNDPAPFSFRYRTVKKSLRFKEATLDDTGIYVCKGTNGFGSQESRIDVIVIGKIFNMEYLLRGKTQYS
jgi:hypothetical protein